MGLAESIQQGFDTAQLARMRSVAVRMLKSLDRYMDTLLDQRRKLCEIIDNCDAELRQVPTSDVPQEMDRYEPN